MTALACPACRGRKNRVSTTRSDIDGKTVSRYRTCLMPGCDHRWLTEERIPIEGAVRRGPKRKYRSLVTLHGDLTELLRDAGALRGEPK